MEVKYDYYDGDRSGDMTDTAYLGFPSTSRLKCMCVLKNGVAFSFSDRWKFQEDDYTPWYSLKTKKRPITMAHGKHEDHKWPKGVNAQWETKGDYKNLTINVSREYSSALYNEEKILFQNQDILKKITNKMELPNYKEDMHMHIDKDCISFDHSTNYFRDFDLNDLPSFFYQFALARKLISFFENKYKDQCDFTSVRVCDYMDSTIMVDICFKRKMYR